MSDTIETLKAKLDRMLALEAEAAQIRNGMTEAESRVARERAEAVIEGRPAPKRDKQSEADKTRLAEIESMLPHASKMLTDAAIKYRNEVAQTFLAAQSVESKTITEKKDELSAQMKVLAAQIVELESGRELRLSHFIERTQTFASTEAAGDVVYLSEQLLSEYADLLNSEAPKADGV